MNARTFLLVLAIAATPATPDIARAENLEVQQKALELITNTADRICNIISTKGEADSLEAKGDVKAQVNRLLSKLADIGVSGSGSLTNETYQNVLRQDLAATLKDNAACKLKVFETLQSKLLETGPARPTPASQPLPVPAPLPAGHEQVVSAMPQPGSPPEAKTPNPRTPPSPVRQKPGYGPAQAALPGGGSIPDMNPALHLAGQRWAFDVDGDSLVINFFAGEDHRFSLSGGRYGSGGTWQPLGSVGFQLTTDTHTSISGWFVQNGSGVVAGCSVLIRTLSRAVGMDANQPVHMVACHRVS